MTGCCRLCDVPSPAWKLYVGGIATDYGLIMKIRNLRLSHGWSQEQLAEMSGVSSRTIQRLERGGNASLESMKCLAAVFEIDINQLNGDIEMSEESAASLTGAQDDKMNDAIERVTEIKRLYMHAGVFILVGMVALILDESRNLGGSGVFYIVSGWGVVFLLHLIYVVLNPSINQMVGNWEKRQIQKQLKK
ncbi:MAG: helix-turn-helix domain-containing protein [Alphaproteobacteria bacterium]|nr:helix-turn-helix domain-containing protein [Alphaproteobacteria bacterium]